VRQGLASVANVQVSVQVVLPQPLRNDVLVFLAAIASLHEITEAQVAIRGHIVLVSFGMMRTGGSRHSLVTLEIVPQAGID